MGKKVLIIDDSALMRRAMSDIIESDSQLTVASTANNGEIALEYLLRGRKYDLILVDINMPKMDGVQFLKEMNKHNIQIPTLVVSSIASESADETIEALALGAFDFVRKPAGQVGQGYQDFKEQILERAYCACDLGTYERGDNDEKLKIELEIEELFKSKKKKDENKNPVKKQVVIPETVIKKGSFSSGKNKLVVIASSTGGPKALQSVVPYFPVNFPYPVVIVQHMPQGFTASLAERLNQMSALTVKEAADGEELKSGFVYIAEGGKQCELMEKENGKYCFSENDKPARRGLRPCADIFFESLVKTNFDEIVCAVLTGMGADGSKGIELIKRYQNVKVVAQNEETCVVYGMPRAAKEIGVVDQVVPLEDVTGMIIKQIGV